MPKSLCDTCAHDCRQPIGKVVSCPKYEKQQPPDIRRGLIYCVSRDWRVTR